MTLDEKARDLKSSGYVLIAVGGVGLIVMILLFTGAVPFEFSGPLNIVLKLIMTLLFLMFLFFGIQSLRKSGAVSEDAKREQEKRDEIKRWFLDNYDSASIDDQANPDGDEDNDLYFDRIGFMRDKISSRFIEVEDSLMSQIIDEIYSELFD